MDVLQVHESGSNLIHDSCEVPEEAGSRIVKSLALPGVGVSLAGVASDDTCHSMASSLKHASSKVSGVECRNVGVNRGSIQGAFAHARSQDADGIGFPFHVQTRSSLWQSPPETHVESPDPGEEGDDGKCAHTRYD